MHLSAYPPPPRAESSWDSERPNVLIVDDDPISLQVLKEALLPEFEVRDTCSAPEAKRWIERGVPFSAVVCDLQMPEMDGIALMRIIREMDPDLPVIVLTGERSLESAVKVMEYRGFRYLTKPYDQDVMLDAVRAATATRRLDLRRRRAFELYESRGGSSDYEIEQQLMEGMRNLFMVYQPIVDAERRSVYGYEALVRAGGVRPMNPATLLQAAEHVGRVHDLGRKVRSLVAQTLDSAPDGTTIFVNLHPLDLRDDDLFSGKASLARHAERIVLEITERAGLGSLSQLSGRLEELRRMGYRIAIDDLGAGYAGLSSFSELGPDIVKLDMSLIRGLDRSHRKQSIVASVLDMCLRALNTRVVCEGVETQEEFATLRGLGADLVQGYLLGRPKEASSMPGLCQGVTEATVG